MAVQPTYPGVYVEEIPSGVRTITGVSTSVTAFIGYTVKGSVNIATKIVTVQPSFHFDSPIGHYRQLKGITTILSRKGQVKIAQKFISGNGMDINSLKSLRGRMKHIHRYEVSIVHDGTRRENSISEPIPIKSGWAIIKCPFGTHILRQVDTND